MWLKSKKTIHFSHRSTDIATWSRRGREFYSFYPFYFLTGIFTFFHFQDEDCDGVVGSLSQHLLSSVKLRSSNSNSVMGSASANGFARQAGQPRSLHSPGMVVVVINRAFNCFKGEMKWRVQRKSWLEGFRPRKVKGKIKIEKYRK